MLVGESFLFQCVLFMFMQVTQAYIVCVLVLCDGVDVGMMVCSVCTELNRVCGCMYSGICGDATENCVWWVLVLRNGWC